MQSENRKHKAVAFAALTTRRKAEQHPILIETAFDRNSANSFGINRNLISDRNYNHTLGMLVLNTAALRSLGHVEGNWRNNGPKEGDELALDSLGGGEDFGVVKRAIENAGGHVRDAGNS